MFYQHSRLSWLSRWALLCALVLTSGAMAFSQATSGTITGLVKDQSGAVVPGASITVRNLETNATRAVISEPDGRYSVPGLPSGPYELTAELPGFAKYVRSPINLLLNQVAVVDPELRPAAASETVVVTEDAPLLNTANSEVGVLFDEKRLTDLPNLPRQDGGGGGFRDVFSYALSAPGVSQMNSGNSGFSTGTAFSVNGMRTRGNNFMIDGQDSNDPSVTGRQQVMNNPDIIKEFRLVTNQFLAEYGRASGSVVNVVTKSGTNDFHGSAFWFHNDNALSSLSNLDKAAGYTEAPFLIENQFGGTVGGPVRKDSLFFFGSLQRWTIRQLGSGNTINGIPTQQGQDILRQTAGTRPQVQALLKFLPPAQTSLGTSVPLTVGGQSYQIPQGSLTNSVGNEFNNWQWSGRLDQQIGARHTLGGRYLYNDSESSGTGQATPPGLTTVVPSRTQALSLFLTSNTTARTLNEARVAWQRLGTVTNAQDPSSEEIPSIEITQLGLTGFNAATSRTAIGLAVNLPQFRYNNTYQIQDNFSWIRGAHTVKLGIDLRRVDVKSFFFPQIRGLLRYSTLQSFVDDVAEAANINTPLPGGQEIQYYKWWDTFFFVQDTWKVTPSFTLNMGVRFERPGNAIASLFSVNDSIVSANGGNAVFNLTPRPGDDNNNWQPRFGFSWNPQTSEDGLIGFLTGGNKLVLRGGYSRTNDFQFINIALNIASSFPFVAAINNSNMARAFELLPTLRPDLSSPSALNQLTRTVVAEDFRTPLAEQFSLEFQRQIALNSVVRVGYVGTKGTGLFQTLDGNPRTACSTPPNCPRVDPTLGTIRTRANSSSSIYHSMQVSMDRRFASGFSGGMHYTWSTFIDDASEIFNPSARGEVAVSQDSFNRAADRARSTYDRPHRFSANFVYELPFYRNQAGSLGRLLGGWQVSSFVTLQSGSPFTPLNGSDPAGALAGISSLVGDAIRPNMNTNLAVSTMTLEELLLAGGRTLFSTLPSNRTQRVGNAGRNILRSDGIANIDLSLAKNTRIMESHVLQFRLDFMNFSNTRNFGIPESRVNNVGFGNQWATNGGNRRIFFSLRYVF
ncbi:MAG: TonB-dependent receptor [Acidobacteria bacterium]|nr:TonB-dependent receptor [Acidobacteriota bacterium]